MGGKPSKGTSKDMRLAANKPAAPKTPPAPMPRKTPRAPRGK